ANGSRCRMTGHPGESPGPGTRQSSARRDRMFLTQLFASYAPVLRDVLPEPLRGLVVTPRRVIACPGGLRIDLRGIGGPGTERSAALLEERLSALPGVERAEVNGRLGCVFVGCDPEAVDREELLEIAR